MKVLYHGCDAFYVAFQGRLSVDVREQLRAAKLRAIDEGQPELESINGVSFHVRGNGAQGGYAFVLDQGEMGVKYLVKDNGDAEDWNIFAQARAEHLLSDGLEGVQMAILEDLAALEGYIVGSAVNRFDYAIDFDAPDFKLDASKIIAHSHSYVSRHYDEDAEQSIQVVGAREISSVTVGKMPNRQIQIYNKRKEAVARRKSFWFKQWGRKFKDERNVWRVEVRLGKKYLKQWNITDIDSFNASFQDMLKDAVEQVRYVSRVDVHNAARSPLSAIWRAVGGVIRNQLSIHSTGIEKGQVKLCLKRDRRDMLSAQMGGIACSIAGILEDGAEIPPDRYDELGPEVFYRYLRQILGRMFDRDWQDTKNVSKNPRRK